MVDVRRAWRVFVLGAEVTLEVDEPGDGTFAGITESADGRAGFVDGRVEGSHYEGKIAGEGRTADFDADLDPSTGNIAGTVHLGWFVGVPFAGENIAAAAPRGTRYTCRSIPMPPKTIPSITGFPVIDSLLTYAILALSVWLTAHAVTIMAAHGYSDVTLSQFLPYVVVYVLVALATAAWGLIAKYRTIVAFVEQVLEAARSGRVPDETKKVAFRHQAPKIQSVNARGRP